MSKLKEITTVNFARVAKYRVPGEVSPNHQESGGGLSMTVPGQAISIRELLIHYRDTGQLEEGIYRPGHFSDNSDFDDVDLEKFSNEDLADKVDIWHDIEERAKEAQAIEREELKAREEARVAKSSPQANNTETQK